AGAVRRQPAEAALEARIREALQAARPRADALAPTATAIEDRLADTAAIVDQLRRQRRVDLAGQRAERRLRIRRVLEQDGVVDRIAAAARADRGGDRRLVGGRRDRREGGVVARQRQRHRVGRIAEPR